MKKKLSNEEIEERKSRILDRGELSDHCHVVTGDVKVETTAKGTIINVEDGVAVMKHLIESEYLKGNEVWTKKHADLPLTEKLNRHGDVLLKKVSDTSFELIKAKERDPLKNIVRRVRD